MPKKLVLSDDSRDIRAVGDFEYRTGTGASSNPKIWTGTAVTITGGLATATLPVGYITTIHSIQAIPLRASAVVGDLCIAYVRSVTLPTIGIQVVEGKSGGIVVGSAGITVYVTVFGV